MWAILAGFTLKWSRRYQTPHNERAQPDPGLQPTPCSHQERAAAEAETLRLTKTNYERIKRPRDYRRSFQ